jgi:octaprenyl-diphosphate synthase
MDYLSLIRRPIEREISEFIDLFNESLSHTEDLLSSALEHIRQRGGKRMRPILTLLIAKNLGQINMTTYYAAVGLELLHTASLVHDDVVDESGERRGQPSVNATFNNKVAVLVGDYILSTALYYVSKSDHVDIVRSLAQLGRTLSNGELHQLNNISNFDFSEDIYYEIIKKKTASLFSSCAENGAMSVNATAADIESARNFGLAIGMIFQIRDDIFDYYDSAAIGKPTGNDMREGKLTLPLIYALNTHPTSAMNDLAKKVKIGTVTNEEINELVEYAKQKGGIDYAVKRMNDYSTIAQKYIDHHVSDEAIRQSLQAYLEFVAQRNI